MTKDILCNMCGLSTKLSESYNYDQFYGLIDAVVSGGYDSTPGNGYGALDDLVNYRFSLCEFCCDHLFSNFVIPPKTSDNSGEMDFLPAAQNVQEQFWRKSKSNFFDEQAKRAEARKNKYVYLPTDPKILEFNKLYSEFKNVHGPLSKKDQIILINLKTKLDLLFSEMTELSKEKYHWYSTGLEEVPKDSELYLEEDIEQYHKYCSLADSRYVGYDGELLQGFYLKSKEKEVKKQLIQMYHASSSSAQKLIDPINHSIGINPNL